MFQAEKFFNIQKSSLAHEFYYFEKLESTNSTAAILARKGCPEGTIVLANEQTKGRGRKGADWYSPPDTNLYFSLVLYPDISRLQYLPFAAGLAVVGALDQLGLQPELKWPNDILVRGKKISGIMMESSLESNSVQHVILGCGINVNVQDFTHELVPSATSIVVETGVLTSRESILASFLMEFETLYEKVKKISWDEFSLEIERRSSYIQGCPVRIALDGETWEGITAGLDSYGGLMLKTPSGKRVFYAGEVQSCRKN